MTSIYLNAESRPVLEPETMIRASLGLQLEETAVQLE